MVYIFNVIVLPGASNRADSPFFTTVRNNEDEGRYQKCREVAIPTHQAFNWIDYGNDPDPDMADHFKKKKFVSMSVAETSKIKG